MRISPLTDFFGTMEAPLGATIESNRCLILEITCPYEQSEEYLSQWKREKEAKYKAVKREKNQVGCETVEVMALVLGSLGIIYKDTWQDIRKLKLASSAEAWRMTTTKGPVNIIKQHMKENDFNPKRKKNTKK